MGRRKERQKKQKRSGEGEGRGKGKRERMGERKGGRGERGESSGSKLYDGFVGAPAGEIHLGSCINNTPRPIGDSIPSRNVIFRRHLLRAPKGRGGGY